MDHVPTLCALSTVGIAATGFALGRPEVAPLPSPQSNKRKAPGLGEFYRANSSPLIAQPRSFSPFTPFRETTSQSSKSAGPRESRGVHQEQDFTEYAGQVEHLTQKTSLATGIDGQSSTPLKPADEEAVPDFFRKPSVRRSTSWLRRISTISSLNDSPGSSLRPDTPSVSFSNTSATPILSTHSSTPNVLPPNKLVKRTSSQRALSTNYPPSSFNQSSTFRRPATSHQRSATLRQLATETPSKQPIVVPQQLEVKSSTHDTNSTYTWKPYFKVNHSIQSQPRKRHTSGPSKSTAVKTITRKPDDLPILVLASSIAMSEDDLDDIADQPYTGIYDDAGATSDDSDDTSSRNESHTVPASEKRPRQSFSITDMFTTSSPTAWKIARSSSVKNKPGESQPPASKRNFSSPIAPQARESKRDKGSKLQRRRNVTDPTIFYPPKSAPTVDVSMANGGAMQTLAGRSSPLPPLSRMSGFDIDLPGGVPSFPSTPRSDSRSNPNNPSYFPQPLVSSHTATGARAQRLSLAISDPASTVFGSDGDTRVFTSGDEDSMEFQSDTAYDSMATRATASSNSGMKGPRIETIFDESPPSDFSRKELVPLEELIQGGSFSEEYSMRSEKSTVDGIEDFSTPVRLPSRFVDETVSRPVQSLGHNGDLADMPSSPPSMADTQILHARHSSTEDIRQSIDAMAIDDDCWDVTADQESTFDEEVISPELPRHSARRVSPLPFRIHQDTPDLLLGEDSTTEQDRRLSVWDWSEQQKSDRDYGNGSSPRPRTVHGKQGDNSRGSRTNRRGPSPLHLRSQSVPVARDSTLESDAQHLATTKFGTWGLGHKGVSEEWNDDFEFDEPEDLGKGYSGHQDENGRLAGGMVVPKEILDRQASVHGQFGHVQEFMLLVEELKRLRVQGGSLDLLEGPSREFWEDAENIINLATLNDDDDDLRPPMTTSSPNGFDDFDDEPPNHARERNSSMSQEGDSRRQSLKQTVYHNTRNSTNWAPARRESCPGQIVPPNHPAKSKCTGIFSRSCRTIAPKEA